MNPNDVFPRRNLGAGEQWGREIETRIVGLENKGLAQKSGLQSENRAAASSMQELSRQLEKIFGLYLAIPKVLQSSATMTGFGLAGGWQTVVTSSITVPAGATQVNLMAVGSNMMIADSGAMTLVQQRSRLIIAGVASPEFEASVDPLSGSWQAISAPIFSRAFAVTPGGAIQVQIQILPADAAAFPPTGANYATIAAMASFTGS